MNTSLVEYQRQCDVIRTRNLKSQEKANRIALIAAGVIIFIAVCTFTAHYTGLIALAY